MTMSWTQAICDECYTASNPDGRTPVRLVVRVTVQCAYCGFDTRSGIFIRDDPALVPYPHEKEK